MTELGATTQYVHGYAPAVQAAHGRRTAENSAGYLLPHLRAGLSLLDVGCGVGSITADLAHRVAPGRVAAVDVSPDVLDSARKAAADRGVHVEFRTADAHALPFADGTFDVVHAHQVLQHVADPVALLREARRVTRPGGLVAVRDADYATTHFHPELPGLQAWLDGYRATARVNSGEPDAGSWLLHWAQQVGFAEITPSASVWTFATPEARGWWGGTWAARVESSTLTERLRANGFEQQNIDAMVADWRTWTAAADGWMTMVHGELLCRV